MAGRSRSGWCATPWPTVCRTAFPDRLGVYGGLTSSPALLVPAAVAEIARALDRPDLDAILGQPPVNNTEAARARGLEGLIGDSHSYLTGHANTLRSFYTTASRRGLAVVAWID